MTPRAERLKPLLKLASRKEEKAVKQMAASQQDLNSFTDKLSQMKSYREEYQKKLEHSTISASMLRDKQQFIQQIDQAIDLLEEQIKQQQSRLYNDQAKWMEAKQKTDIYDKVVEKIQQTEKMIQDERELRELEDRVCMVKTNNT